MRIGRCGQCWACCWGPWQCPSLSWRGPLFVILLIVLVRPVAVFISTVGAKMMLTNTWRGQGVFNVEEFDPRPFLEELAVRGLPWHVKEM